MNFDGFHPFTTSKTDDRKLFFFGACRKDAAIFTLLLLRRIAFQHRTATCWPLFKPSVSLGNRGVFRIFISHLEFHLILPRSHQAALNCSFLIARTIFTCTDITRFYSVT